jgi:hypothetical protein
MSLNGPLRLKGRRLMLLSANRVAVILAGKHRTLVRQRHLSAAGSSSPV